MTDKFRTEHGYGVQVMIIRVKALRVASSSAFSCRGGSMNNRMPYIRTTGGKQAGMHTATDAGQPDRRKRRRAWMVFCFFDFASSIPKGDMSRSGWKF